MKIKLDSLNPEFFILEKPNMTRPTSHIECAHGLSFDCPTCENTHRIEVLDSRIQGSPRWEFSGSGIEDLSLMNSCGNGTISSIDCSSSGVCKAHFYIEKGYATLGQEI